MAEYYAYNAVGSVVANTDQQGFVIRENDFDAYGNVVREQDWESDNFPAIFGGSQNDLLFSTKERDFSTGLDYFGFRYYDSVLGKFITRDPSGYPDGPNNYLYVRNNPINSIDPLGLKKRDLTDKERERINEAIRSVIQSRRATKNPDDHTSGVKEDLKILQDIADNVSDVDEYGYVSNAGEGKNGKVTIVVETEKNIKGTNKPRSDAHYDSRNNTITINESVFKSKDVKEKLIEIIYHEGTHSIQDRTKKASIDREVEGNTIGNLALYLANITGKRDKPASSAKIQRHVIDQYYKPEKGINEDTGASGPNNMQLDPSFGETKGYNEAREFAEKAFNSHYENRDPFSESYVDYGTPDYGNKFSDYKKSESTYKRQVQRLHQKRQYNNDGKPGKTHRFDPANSRHVNEQWQNRSQ